MNCGLDHIAKLFTIAWWKLILSAGVALMVSLQGEPPHVWKDLMTLLLVLIVLDMFTGIVKSFYVKQAGLSALGVQRTILKLMVYAVVLLISGFVDHLFSLVYAFSSMVVAMCIFREGTSVGENTQAIWEKACPDVPFPFSKVFKKLEKIGELVHSKENGQATVKKPKE